MEIEIILIRPVRTLGEIAEIFKVKAGYARHYLLARKLAIRLTEANKQLIEAQKHDLKQKDEQAKSEAAITNNIINNKELVFIRQSADDGKLFGSVTNKEIAESLSKICSYKISHLNIVLDKPIKSTGVFTVEVSLHPSLIAKVTVIVARSESEAQDYKMDNKQTDINFTEDEVAQ